MKRTERATLAAETVAIITLGHYTTGGQRVAIADAVHTCLAATRYYPPADAARLSRQLRSAEPVSTRLELRNETTLAGIQHLLAERSGPVLALNFASAKNPGGGFLGGSEAQEESLARSSALYASQRTCPEFYDTHRAAASLLYSDALIVSPDCPIIRDDDGELLPEPRLATFLTCAAPNAGATESHRPRDAGQIAPTLLRRAEIVLGVAAALGYANVVLGAWGCGVFKNEPRVVAAAFRSLLGGHYFGRFKRVRFSVLDRTPGARTFAAFAGEFELPEPTPFQG